MEKQSYGSVVAMEFRRPPSIAFRDIVEEFDIAFQMADSHTRALTWDNDDIALIDRDCVRVGLGWLPAQRAGQPSHLVVAVGTPPGADRERRINPRSFRYRPSASPSARANTCPTRRFCTARPTSPWAPD
ncbi:MAG: hypothetical protein M5U35_06520 [Roseovarius sp.]|nr:hypothetical protein [Roseovarius sp.]